MNTDAGSIINSIINTTFHDHSTKQYLTTISPYNKYMWSWRYKSRIESFVLMVDGESKAIFLQNRFVSKTPSTTFISCNCHTHQNMVLGDRVIGYSLGNVCDNAVINIKNDFYVIWNCMIEIISEFIFMK